MRVAALLACLAALWPTGTLADTALAHLQVSAFVQPAASLSTVTAPARLAVTPDDLRRQRKSYLATYRLTGNSPAGYLLRIDPLVGLAQQVTVRGMTGSVRVTDQPVEVSIPAAARDAGLDLQVDVHLRQDLPIGDYPLPVRLSVSPLPALD